VLYEDPVTGYPSAYARDDIPDIERYPGGQTDPQSRPARTLRRRTEGLLGWKLTFRGFSQNHPLSELQGTQEIDHCSADFVRSFLLRPVAAALEHDGTAQLRYEAR
jgi:hypothetical protein